MDETINKIYTIQSDYYDGRLLVQDPAKSLIQSFEDVFGPWENYPGTELPPEEISELPPLIDDNISNALIAFDGAILVDIEGNILINI
jgi:hypothetical protein